MAVLVASHAVHRVEQQQPPARRHPHRAVAHLAVGRAVARAAERPAPLGESTLDRVEVVVARHVEERPAAKRRALLLPKAQQPALVLLERRAEGAAAADGVAHVHRKRAAAHGELSQLRQQQLRDGIRIGHEQPVSFGQRVALADPLSASGRRQPEVSVADDREAKERLVGVGRGEASGCGV